LIRAAIFDGLQKAQAAQGVGARGGACAAETYLNYAAPARIELGVGAGVRSSLMAAQWSRPGTEASQWTTALLQLTRSSAGVGTGVIVIFSILHHDLAASIDSNRFAPN
jgi:hypothetical protein